MKQINQGLFTGERALFKARDLKISNSVFADGESPLKESSDILLDNAIFRWKYPLWYSRNITANNITLVDTARSGIWYTHDITITDSMIQAPKTFRRASDISLERVELPNAQETFWNCKNITLKQVNAAGDYFAMNSENISIEDFSLSGNYAFDGAKNIEVKNAKLISKDAFWNCENVVVRDSTIIGEYLGWNSKNITFIDCIIESNQGMCYMEDLKMENCTIINTDLAFEYSTVDVQATTTIDSIKNPISGTITAAGVGEWILDDPEIAADKTKFHLAEEPEYAIRF
ncbi:pectin lyase fold/virulence factor [Trichococcus palustris]|jgi:hypothetical protein|uniref:Pectin lyase fold/virulence factor n=1 Tax=Trichococcus palustris TaxID=140314 RepID=A0A143YIE7_9LACT|nr:DUF3737 family protein [Trichococcus palustris]CZQ89708.1 pectin lyase fold/virulence factor [Trichococcus palustris]SFK98323.1 Protein of unknown function [Trichococcus palustris]